MVDRLVQWVSQYEEIIPQLAALKGKLDGLTRELLEDAQIKVIQVESRVKTLESFSEKLERKGGSYANPLEDITDLVGLRVITYYREDLERIGELIRREFIVDDDNSVMKGSDYEPDRFGYRSDQYIISLQENRKTLPEWRRLPDIRWEVQVRTVLQHAWAAVEHKLYYKSASDAPPEVRRRLFALSALFELGDREFSAIRYANDALNSRLKNEVSEGNFDIPFNYSSLAAYLDAHPYPQQLRETLRAHGNAMTPAAHRRIIESSQSELAYLLSGSEITSIAKFHAYLKTDVEPVLQAVGLFARPQGVRSPFEGYLLEAILITRVRSESDFYEYGFDESEWPQFKANLDRYLESCRSG